MFLQFIQVYIFKKLNVKKEEERKYQSWNNKKKKNLNEKEALIIFCQLIDAMKYMHNMNICNRDIKPENILFDENNKI